MKYTLPKSLNICGTEYEIYSDYREILDVCEALSDPELSDEEKAEAALFLFYPSIDDMPVEHYVEALRLCYWFINGGEEESGKNEPKVIDWEQDAGIILAEINKRAKLGEDIRLVEYCHWWTFRDYYMCIGDGLFAQVVAIRDKLARHKNLEKHEREWYNRNKKLVDFKTTYTDSEMDFLKQWI